MTNKLKWLLKGAKYGGKESVVTLMAGPAVFFVENFAEGRTTTTTTRGGNHGSNNGLTSIIQLSTRRIHDGECLEDAEKQAQSSIPRLQSLEPKRRGMALLEPFKKRSRSAQSHRQTSPTTSGPAQPSFSTSSASLQQLSAKYGSTNIASHVESCWQKLTSCRWVTGYMCCAARFCQSAIRQCIGMAIVCMTAASSENVLPSTTPTAEFTAGGALTRIENAVTPVGRKMSQSFNDMVTFNTSNAAEMQAGEFAWSSQTEGLILNAFTVGSFCSPILGGYMAAKHGGKRVVLGALLSGGVATVLVPLAAHFNDVAVVVLRLLAGIFLGVLDPAIQAMWAKWAPQCEKAKLTTCSYTGLSLAGIVTFFISGYLCGIPIENGWPFIFYFFGGLSLLCAVPWFFLVYDSPEQHPRILDYEIILISNGKRQHPATKKLKVPWHNMLTSGPFWAIVVAHISYTWVATWLMSYLPKYLNDVMKFNIKEDGLYSSLPFVGRLLSGMLCGYLSDQLQRKEVLSTGACRKLFQSVGCFGCAACAVAVGFLDHTSRGVAVFLLVMSMTFQNATSVAFRINHLDIAPRFAGIMMGMTVTLAMGITVTGPPVTAAIVKNGTQQEWQIVFIIVAFLNVVGACVFCAFGSGDVQDWALPTEANFESIVTIHDAGTLSMSHRKDNNQADGFVGNSFARVYL